MNSEKLKYAVIGFALGALSFWIASTQLTNISSIKMMDNELASQSPFSIDSHFIEQMIPHHEDAITMSKLAIINAKRAEVKQLANDIIDAQSKEIDQMKTWYKSWFGKEIPTDNQVMQHHGMKSASGLHMEISGDTSDITNLENAADFDKEYVISMIPHHQMAVMMASMLKTGTSRPEMKTLADNIITSQTEEIEMMRKWLSEWK